MRSGFLATLIGAMNGFVVLVYGAREITLKGDYLLGGLLILLGILGLVVAYIHRFGQRREVKKVVPAS